MRLLHNALLTEGRKARTSSLLQPRALVKARSEIPSSPSRNMDRSHAPISFYSFCQYEKVTAENQYVPFSYLSAKVPRELGAADD